MQKHKVFRDPIHQYIVVNDEVIWQLINTATFQRLNNIRQLGGAYQIFHGAVHTRFGHSLGAYAIAYDMYTQVAGLKNNLSEYERLLLYTTALLHDIGHGPFSHAAETFLTLDHEMMGCKIILEDPSIRQILDNVSSAFASDVISVLQNVYPNKLLSQIISHQVDVDRMDYLLRDSYYAGVPYGKYDKDRILRVMKVIDGKLYFSQTGIYALENFMLSRYHMQQQVYQNPKGRAFEYLLALSVQRFLVLYQQNQLTQHSAYDVFYRFLTCHETSDVSEFLCYNDYMFLAVQQTLMSETDPVIQLLSENIIQRNLPKMYELSDKTVYDFVHEALLERQIQEPNTEYFIFCEVISEDEVYKKDVSDGIMLIDEAGNKQSFEVASRIVGAVLEHEVKQRYYLYVDMSYVAHQKQLLHILTEIGMELN